MHTDDHILETFLASNKPLAAIASDLSITLIALVHWLDRNADLLAVAKRALETHITFLALKAEAAALHDLTTVSRSSTNEERKRKSASQLLRHTAKRLLTAVGAPPSPRNASSTNPTRERGAPCASESPSGRLHPLASSSVSNAESRMPNAASLSTNPTRERGVPYASESPADLLASVAGSPQVSSSLDASMPPASMPSSLSNAECPMPNASSSPLHFSDHEIDVLMATLAHHFNIDLSTINDPPTTATDPAAIGSSAYACATTPTSP